MSRTKTIKTAQQGANVIPFRRRATVAPQLLTPPPEPANLEYVDLNERYMPNPETTIALTVSGPSSSWSPQIEEGDVVVVDYGDDEKSIMKFDGFNDFTGACHVGVVLHILRTIREVKAKKRKGGAR